MYRDPSAEVAEPHLLFEENSFPPTTTIPKDDDPKRVDTLIEAIHADMLKKEIDHQQKASFQSNDRSEKTKIALDDREDPTIQISSERSLRTTHVNFQLPQHRSIDEDREKQGQHHSEDLSSNPLDEPSTDHSALSPVDLKQLLTEDEYIPGGFINLDEDVEVEFLNDYIDEFDHLNKERQRNKQSIRSTEPRISVIRSPIELWQRARLMIAIHLYQLQNRTLPGSNPSTTELSSHVQEVENKDKALEMVTIKEKQQIICGVQILRQIDLNSSEQYLYVDHYGTDQKFVFMCNIYDANETNRVTDDRKWARQYRSRLDSKMMSVSNPNNQLRAYTMSREDLKVLSSISFYCPFECYRMICIPMFRLILAIVNTNTQSAWILLIGDPSRQGIFLSKQELPHTVHSCLHIPTTSLLLLGCQGRVLLYNTQPLRYTSQPLFTSALTGLSLHPLETIIDLCHVENERSVGILSGRSFILWQYSNTEQIRLKYCNPYTFEFNRCYYVARFRLLILTFNDGLLHMYQLSSMKQLRRYHCHWKSITSLISNHDQTYLLSSSEDHQINIWNLETLQHLYRYESSMPIDQMGMMHNDLFYYRTKHQLIVFRFNLPTMLFSSIEQPMKSMKLVTDGQKVARLIVLLENNSSILLSPVNGSCLSSVPHIGERPVKQILHDINRENFYALQKDGEILLYNTENTPCVAEYKIQSKSHRYTITCMALINPNRTKLVEMQNMNPSIESSLDKPLIFFGHTNGYISLYQGESLMMEPVQAHSTGIVCLESSQTSLEQSNIFLTRYEILLSSNDANEIRLWDFALDIDQQSIQLVPFITVVQEKNVSSKSIGQLLMIDNFIVAYYSDQKFLHLWQLVNISISISKNEKAQWGIVEHSSKGNPHRGHIRAITGTCKLKLVASADNEASVKFWDKTNSLYREILFDRSLTNIEFLSITGEFLLAYQKNVHLILPDQYLIKKNQSKHKATSMKHWIAEDNRLEVIQPFIIPYNLLPIFIYSMKTHHSKKHLNRFERQLAGRLAIVESESSPSDDETSPSNNVNRLSTESDDPSWSGLADHVKDILRMKREQEKHHNQIRE